MSTNKKTLQKQLRAINRKLAEAEAADDQIETAACLSQRAGIYVLLGHWTEAAADLGRVAALAAADGELFYQARALYGQAKALANVPGKEQEAIALLQQTAVLQQKLGNTEPQAEALLQLAELQLSTEAYQAALDTAAQGIACLSPKPEHKERLLAFYRLRMLAWLFLLQFEQAAAELETAVTLAETHDWQKEATELRWQQQTLASLLNGETSPNELVQLLQRAKATDQPHILQDVQLQQAQQAWENGRYQNAIEEAENALTAIRQATDPGRFMRYFYASLIIAQAQESLNNRVGVLVALLRCKVYLETHLGKEAGTMMNKLLDSLQKPWGVDGLNQAAADYREWVAANGPIVV